MQLSKLVSLFKKYGTRAGFTLIELLVVIAILGVLAATVIAAINPIEQINRAQDTAEQSDAQQLLTGVQRYYTANGVYPWNTVATSGTLVWAAADKIATPQAAFTGFGAVANAMRWGASMELSGELTKGLLLRLSLQNQNGNPLYVWKPADAAGSAANPTYACFLPKSLTYKNQALADCTNGANPAAVAGFITPCASPAALGTSYICEN